MVLPHSVPKVTKGATDFGETVVHVLGNRGVIGDYITEVCKLLLRVEWIAGNGDLGWAVHYL